MAGLPKSDISEMAMFQQRAGTYNVSHCATPFTTQANESGPTICVFLRLDFHASALSTQERKDRARHASSDIGDTRSTFRDMDMVQTG